MFPGNCRLQTAIIRTRSLNRRLRLKISVMQICEHRITNFYFCQRRSQLPRFFISYYYGRRIIPFHNVCFSLISYIPRSILWLRSYSIFTMSCNARNDSFSKSPCTRLSALNFKTVQLLQSKRVTMIPKLISFSSVVNFLNTSVENLVNFACNFCIIN